MASSVAPPVSFPIPTFFSLCVCGHCSRLELYHQSDFCRGLRLTSFFTELPSPIPASSRAAILHHKSDYITPRFDNFPVAFCWARTRGEPCPNSLASWCRWFLRISWRTLVKDEGWQNRPLSTLMVPSDWVLFISGNLNAKTTIFIEFLREMKGGSKATSFGFCPFRFCFFFLLPSGLRIVVGWACVMSGRREMIGSTRKARGSSRSVTQWCPQAHTEILFRWRVGRMVKGVAFVFQWFIITVCIQMPNLILAPHSSSPRPLGLVHLLTGLTHPGWYSRHKGLFWFCCSWDPVKKMGNSIFISPCAYLT